MLFESPNLQFIITDEQAADDSLLNFMQEIGTFDDIEQYRNKSVISSKENSLKIKNPAKDSHIKPGQF